MKFLNYSEIDFDFHLKKLGLKKNMNLVIHASLMLFLNKNSPNLLFNSIMKILGDNGTIFFPLFSFRSHGNSTFKKLKTKPNSMGLLSNYIWENHLDEINRSNCFIHSYGGIGKNKNLLDLIKIDRSYGKGSFFDLAYQKNMFFIAFGLNLTNGCTQIHNSENIKNVDYKKKILLRRKYEINGKIKKVNYNYHRKSKKIKSDFSKLEELLLKKKLINKVHLTNKVYSLSGYTGLLQENTLRELKKNPLLLVKS